MAVVIDHSLDKNASLPKGEKHSKLYNCGVRLQRYLLSKDTRVRGQWVPRQGPHEEKMHRVTMLRFYRFCLFMKYKTFRYDRNGSYGHGPGTVYYSHNLQLNMCLIEDGRETFLTDPGDDSAIPIFIKPIEHKEYKGFQENSIIRIVKSDGSKIEIPIDADIRSRIDQFIVWVHTICPMPDETVATDYESRRRYDQEIWDHIFIALGLNQYAHCLREVDL